MSGGNNLMAQTFKMLNGDIVVSVSTGQPKLIGNAVGETDKGTAKQKAVSDMQRCLSLERVSNGTGAGIVELKGYVPGFGSMGVAVLMNRQIRNMFASILRVQKNSPVYRPLYELLSSIVMLQVIPQADMTSFYFKVDVVTAGNVSAELSGSISGNGV